MFQFKCGCCGEVKVREFTTLRVYCPVCSEAGRLSIMTLARRVRG